MAITDPESTEPVTITLPYRDFVYILSDISAAHSEFCIMTDKCDCIEREARLSKALEAFDEECQHDWLPIPAPSVMRMYCTKCDKTRPMGE